MEKMQFLLVRILTAVIAVLMFNFSSLAIDKEVNIFQTSMSYFQLDPSATTTFSLSPQSTEKDRIFVVAEQNSPLNHLNVQAGAGYALPVSAQLNLKAAMLYQEDSTHNPNEQPVKHIAIEAGTQFKLNQAIQVYSAIVYRVPKVEQKHTSEEIAKEVGFKISGEYFFSQSVSAGIHAQIIAENKIYGVQGSFHF